MAEIENSINNRESINTVWEIIETALKIAVNKFVPKCQPKNCNIREPLWFNNTARRMVRQQRKLYDTSKRTGSDEDQNKYRLARRNNKKFFRKMEQEHYNRVLFEPLTRGDSKLFYSFYKRKSGLLSRIYSF